MFRSSVIYNSPRFEGLRSFEKRQTFLSKKYLIGLYKKDFPFNNFQFDSLSFMQQYHILGVQRSIKILGIFARLAILETNQNYLVHMPRVICYIKRIMQSGSIQALACWLNQNFKETFNV